MLIRGILFAAAVLAGAFSGPMALTSAAASRPPMTWSELAFMAIGALVGLPLVLGLQAMQGNFNALRLGWALFLYVAVYCAAAGLAALVVALRGPGVEAHAFMFLVLGAAMLGGLALVRLVFRRRFAVR